MNRLRKIRFLEDVTQPLLSFITGIQQSRISLIENGLIIPTEEEKKLIAKALHHKVEKIFMDGTQN
jgi:transcriptional regulator with XRE-family HTH domain